MLSFFLSTFLITAYADDVIYADNVGYYSVSVDDAYLESEYFDEYDYEEDEDYYYEDFEQSIVIASPSDFSFTGRLEDYFIPLENKPESIESASEDIILLSEENSPVLLAPLNRAIGFDDDYKNTVVFTGTFGGNTARLVIPYDRYSELTLVNGVLLNIGNSSVTGRLLYGSNQITHNGYDTYNYTLNSVYGSTSNVWRYGSFNYLRHYYLYTNPSTGSQSINYSDTYGNFIVTDVDIHYSDNNRLYYALLVFGVLGVLVVCLKH